MSAPPQSPNRRLITIIATYNERSNLPDLIDQLQQLIPAMQILVIDDNSPDGTGTWCRAKCAADPNFQCIHRASKLGLGSATITGFQWALSNGFDLVATMDADFSHAPSSLLTMVEAFDAPANHDVGVVIGSRYIPGGAILGWPILRHASSRLVNAVARLFLRLPTHDNSGAFRVYRADTLRAIGVSQIQAQGYAYLEEILWRINRRGIKMLETPITFQDRTQGKSKTSLRMGLQVFWHLFKIACRRIR